MGKMKSLIILFTYIRLACAFFVPSGFLKLSCQDNTYIIDSIVDKSEGTQLTHTGNIRARSLDTQTEDLKTRKDLDDLVLKDVDLEDKNNLNERSFVYLKQKHRTPIINLVHGAHAGLGKSHSKSLDDYSLEFIKKPYHSYIDRFLKESSLFNHMENEAIESKIKLARLSNKLYPGHSATENANEIDKNIYDKLKIVELLKAPLVRCQHKKDKYEKRNEVYNENMNEGYPSAYGNNNGVRLDLAYPVHPTRNHQHLSSDHRGKPAEKQTLCSHIYQSHIKDCVHRIYGKDANENTFKVLTNCIKELK